MHISQLKESRFLQKAEVGQAGMVFTIRDCTEENVASQNDPPEYKWALWFEETEKGMVLNTTNGQLIAQALGSETTEDWIGRQICIYHDPSVSFGGKLVGGLRARSVDAPPPSPPPSPFRRSPARQQSQPTQNQQPRQNYPQQSGQGVRFQQPTQQQRQPPRRFIPQEEEEANPFRGQGQADQDGNL